MRQLAAAALLSTTAGVEDVIGFLTFGGVSLVRVTRNLVVLAVEWVTRRFSEVGPLLAVPIGIRNKFFACAVAIPLWQSVN